MIAPLTPASFSDSRPSSNAFMNFAIDIFDSMTRPITLGNIIRGNRRDVRVARTVKAEAALISNPRVTLEKCQSRKSY
jgi:hypothetical protein